MTVPRAMLSAFPRRDLHSGAPSPNACGSNKQLGPQPTHASSFAQGSRSITTGAILLRKLGQDWSQSVTAFEMF